jgi:hypothetical protein
MSKHFHVSSLEAELNDLEIPDGPTIDKLTISSSRASVGGDPFQLVMEEHAEAVAHMSAQSMADFLNLLAPGGLKEFEITLGEGSALVTAKVQIVVEIPVEATCSLSIHNECELWVDVDQVEVMGGSAKKLVEGHLAKVNPIFTTDDLPIPATLSSTKITPDGIELYCSVLPGSWD